ncbi:MAG: hypothetical protein JNM80_10385 [Phycisphaerae bacterium]|nr:hypothetical protein [Phycisphaerae bacterium]
MQMATDDNLVDPSDACPLCSERRVDLLVWIDDDHVECTMCGTVYQPGSPHA